MKHDKGMARGWQKVFGFSFIQFIKTKSFIVGTVIMCVIVMLLGAGANIIPKLMGAGDMLTGSLDQTNALKLDAVYLRDETGLLNEEDTAALEELGARLTESGSTSEQLISELSEESAGKILAVIAAEEEKDKIAGYTVKLYYSPDTDSESIDTLSGLLCEAVKHRNLLNAGVRPEDYEVSQRYVSASKIQAGSDEWSVFETMINYIVPIVISLILFILIFAYGQTVAQSIATEKTSKVMELLLTSVRPLAVVIGKVLAMGLVSLLQFMLICIVGAVSFIVTMPFGIGGDLIRMMGDPALQTGENAELAQALNSSFSTLSPLTFLLIFIIFILGFLFFALIAALVGASVSRMEDLAQAMQPYSLIGVFGFYLAYFPAMFTMDSFETGAASTNFMQIFSYYCPISSPFSLPSALLLGSLPLPQVIAAVVVLAVFVVLIAVIVARVYELIILHNGSRIKFSDIIKMAGKK